MCFLTLVPIHLPEDFSTNLQVVLRWLHFLGGITWVGSGYLLVLAALPWQRSLEPGTRTQAAVPLLRRALRWHRWASVVAVVVGLWLWMLEVGTDRRAAGQSGSTLIWSFFVLWTLAFAIYMGVLMSPARALHSLPLLALVTTLLVVGASYTFLRLNSHGWETNRVLAIGIGGGIGWFMMLNLWGLIWRSQKRLLNWTSAGTQPPQASELAHVAALAAKMNVALSLPMLFFMAVASHYPMFGG